MTITYTPSLLSNISNPTSAVTTINANETAVSSAFQSALNVTGDSMSGTLNMNSQQIINLPAPATANSPARLQDITASTQTSVLAANVTNILANSILGNLTSSTASAVSLPTSGSGAVLLASAPTMSNPTFTGSPKSAALTVSTGILVTSASASTITLTANPTSSAYNLVFPASQSSVGQFYVTAVNNAGSVWMSNQTLTATLVQGNSTGSAAPVGFLGEYQIFPSSSVFTLTNNTPVTVASGTLSPGDWQVDCSGYFNTLSNTATTGGALAVLSSTSAPTSSAWDGYSFAQNDGLLNGAQMLSIPGVQVLLASSQTIYLILQGSFSGSATGLGKIRARRMR
jgi:hypothetical protein